MALPARKVSEAFEKRDPAQGILPGSTNVFVARGGGGGGEVTTESCNIFFNIFKL